ncbi:MAG: transcription elongation factor GreA [Gammaproteobacteria bacterium RIFCSPLOWO2_02_FULL_61_13]|nr:MAG: transcription elongation factor GreA [Gammaproteobacteria bacterium RIFCSPLOWO2_02_FULL_61_13]
MPKSPLTANGAERLRLLLAELKSVRRPQIIQAIAEARAHGDLSENAEYHAAREQQSFVEGRIGVLESVLADAQIIDVAGIKAAPKVVFGATVELLNLTTKKTVTYQIVGEEEADINLALISITSPIARALIGKEEGEVANVNAPGGMTEYEIVSVRYQ